MTAPASWLMLRGLAREKRHFGEFPATFSRLLPGRLAFPMDLVGFGALSREPVPWTLGEIVEELRPRFLAERPNEGPWSIFAISLGGMVALEWAARYPQDFASVVVANTSAGDQSSLWQRFRPVMWPKLPGLLFGDARARERTILEVTVNSAIDKDALAVTWCGYYHERKPSQRAFIGQMVAAARSRLPASLQPRLLVLASKADRLVSWRCSERIAVKLGARLELHAEAGHDLSLDAPEWICERIAAFHEAA